MKTSLRRALVKIQQSYFLRHKTRRTTPTFTRRAFLETLENRSLLAALYVDNTPTLAGPTLDVFTPSGGSQVVTGGLTSGLNLFTTISAAVAAANPTDTINVADGSYAESVVVNKALTIRGNQAGVDARGRVAAESIVHGANNGFAVDINASGVTIDGFQFCR